MNTWPNNIPAVLRRRLDSTLSQRSVNSAAVWWDVVDWLRKHEVEPPDHPLPESFEQPGNG